MKSTTWYSAKEEEMEDLYQIKKKIFKGKSVDQDTINQLVDLCEDPKHRLTQKKNQTFVLLRIQVLCWSTSVKIGGMTLTMPKQLFDKKKFNPFCTHTIYLYMVKRDFLLNKKAYLTIVCTVKSRAVARLG